IRSPFRGYLTESPIQEFTMPTRFPFSTKAQIGGQTIQLRHKGLWLGKSNNAKITGMFQRAKALLSATIAALSSGPDADCIKHANTYFLCTPTAGEWQNIAAKLKLVHGGLNTDVTLKL